MKKRLSSCLECGDNTSILTQVSSGPEVALLCANCYSLKYSKESQSEIDHNEEEEVILNNTKPINIFVAAKASRLADQGFK